MKEYSKGIYVKFKPEEVEILHDRMKEAGVQNMSAYIRKMAINGYVIIPEWPDLNRLQISQNNLHRLIELQTRKPPCRIAATERFSAVWTRRESNPRPFGCEPNAHPN